MIAYAWGATLLLAGQMNSQTQRQRQEGHIASEGMLAIAPHHPSGGGKGGQKRRQVTFVDWNSKEEQERSARGVAFRLRLKEDSRQKKRAEAAARQADRIQHASRVYAALIS